MNFVYLSPHFPPNYYLFPVQLHHLGVNVLGLADEPQDNLRPELKTALRAYYRVDDMHNYDQLLRAIGYFTHHYGKIDHIDSHNEYWLGVEARLRTDFNITGPKTNEIVKMRHKSLMKQMFSKAGVASPRGKVVRSEKEARELIAEVGYPLVAKPDSGVGAAHTFKIHTDAELSDFFARKPPVDYIMEEFIQGKMYTFDGLTDRQGRLVFYTSHTYSQGIMEVVNDDSLVYYYSLREIPDDLLAAGQRILKVYRVRERFFHFEFFRKEDGQLIALEVNMRPPGGLTTDMFNYANDIDIYREWANVVVLNRFTSVYTRPYHCCYVCRKFNRHYAHSHEEILAAFQRQLCHHEAISGIFSAALGDYGYLVRSPWLEEIFEIAAFIHELG